MRSKAPIGKFSLNAVPQCASFRACCRHTAIAALETVLRFRAFAMWWLCMDSAWGITQTVANTHKFAGFGERHGGV
jgi:hypothetical protein